MGSWYPKEIPITTKNVPSEVWEIKSTIVSRPDIAHAAIKSAREQYHEEFWRTLIIIL